MIGDSAVQLLTDQCSVRDVEQGWFATHTDERLSVVVRPHGIDGDSAAVDRVDAAGHERCLLAEQERDDVGDLVRPPGPAEWSEECAGIRARSAVGCRPRRSEQVCRNDPGRDRIHADADRTAERVRPRRACLLVWYAMRSAPPPKEQIDALVTRELLEGVYDLFPMLRDVRRRPAAALSGGQQQMVAIGRMLMSDPNLLLLDEPSLGLAPIAIGEVAKAVMTLREDGRSILLVEQRVDLALQVCDRVYVLAGGEVVLEDNVGALAGDGRSLIDAYLG
jgi:hypothetical protein